ncbi:histone H1-delta-like [Nematostella vectensis]|uniref:histone H1-delta-like n=1 Tax=Nematostella vectensis TaxID=45351 RepID=UPI0020778318|nr:histone H1-delta-like [Nematostella vectensis]
MSTAAKPAKKPAEHPKYTEMVAAAIDALKERSGSSRQAIEKCIKANYKVGDNVDTYLKLALKRMSEKGTLVHTKGTGASGSFKLNKAAVKAEKPKKAKKPAAKKPKAAKKPAAKTTPFKKAKSPKKPAPKKATKSPKKAAKKPVAKKPAVAKPKKAANKLTAKKAAKKPAKK